MERTVLEKDIARFSYSCMSNTKWKKLFSVVNEGNLELANCTWKLVDEAEPKNGFVPDCAQLGENYVGDCGALNGPFEFKRIEWLKLPTTLGYRMYEKGPIQFRTQNLSYITEQLRAIGNFEIEVSSEGITVYGYKL